jgi:hypothetical protein
MPPAGDRHPRPADRARVRWFGVGGGLAGIMIGVLAEPLGIPIVPALAGAALLLGVAAALVAASVGR